MMTVGEVSKLTGVTVRALHIYDKKGLLCPMRSGEGVANDRRLYDEDDLERLEKIVVLQAYGLELSEIAAVLDGGVSAMRDALLSKVEDLKHQQNRPRNLILFTRLVEMSNGEFFECLACGPMDIDDMADAIRDSPYYQQGIARIRSYSDQEWEELIEELDIIVYDLMHLGEEEGFLGVERQIDRFSSWWSEHVAPMESLGYLGFWAIFEDETLIAARAEEIGGEEVSASIQMHAFFVCMKRLMSDAAHLIDSISENVDSDVVVAMRYFEELVLLIAVHMGLRDQGSDVGSAAEMDSELLDICDMVLGYMVSMLSDEELMAYIDPANEIDIEIGSLDKVGELMEKAFAIDGSE